MADFILLMHDDAEFDGDMAAYIQGLAQAGCLRGGSAIGSGACFRKDGAARPVSGQLGGFIRIEARDMDEARSLLSGNPVFENGGTVEIRELPRSD